MLLLKKGCCCLELSTCTTVIGWWWTIGSISYIIQFIMLEKDNFSEYFRFPMALCQLTASCYLIHGAKTSDKRMVLPWIILQIFNLVITNIVLFYIACAHGDYILGIIVATADGIMAYLLVIVYSFYDELKTNSGDDGDLVHIV